MYTYPLISLCPQYPPLTRSETNTLILKAQHGDRQAKELVFNHNLRLLFKVISSFKPDYQDNSYENKEDIEDLIIDLSTVLWNCIDKFDVGKKYAFSTYVHRAFTNKSITFFKNNKRYKEKVMAFSSYDDHYPPISSSPLDVGILNACEVDVLDDLMEGVSREKIIASRHLSEKGYEKIVKRLQSIYIEKLG